MSTQICTLNTEFLFDKIKHSMSYLLTGVLAATGVTVLIVTTEGGAPTGPSLGPKEGGGNLSYIDAGGIWFIIMVGGGAVEMY